MSRDLNEEGRAAYTFGAFRGCQEHGRRHGIAYRAVLETTGLDAVGRLLDASRAAGVRCSNWSTASATTGPYASRCRDHYAVLDVLDREGDIMTDYCIPDRAAWEWWVQAAELRITSTECPALPGLRADRLTSPS
jgi:hypothetical protein